MSKNDLEKAYTPSQWSQRLPANEIVDAHYLVLKKGSDNVRKKFTTEHDVIYGPSNSQKLEIVYKEDWSDDAPVLVFIHGGYWVAGCPEVHFGIAEHFVTHGAIFVAVGYDLAPNVSMPEIVQQVKTAFAFIFNRFPNTRGVYLTGHSAGGQLAARIMEVDWSENGLKTNPLKGAVLMSGLFDLRPLLHTSVNDDVHMTEDIAKQESPVKHVVDVGKHCRNLERMYVVVGEMESPEFKQQSFNYTECCRGVGINTEYKVIENVDHFNLIENLMNEDYVLTNIIQKMLGL